MERMTVALLAGLLVAAGLCGLYALAGAFFYGLSRLYDWSTATIRDAWATRGRRVPR